jgi:hypothetical protein
MMDPRQFRRWGSSSRAHDSDGHGRRQTSSHAEKCPLLPPLPTACSIGTVHAFTPPSVSKCELARVAQSGFSARWFFAIGLSPAGSMPT